MSEPVSSVTMKVLQPLWNESSPRMNNCLAYSNYSYSGIGPKECALNLPWNGPVQGPGNIAFRLWKPPGKLMEFCQLSTVRTLIQKHTVYVFNHLLLFVDCYCEECSDDWYFWGLWSMRSATETEQWTTETTGGSKKWTRWSEQAEGGGNMLLLHLNL